jgi:hypothetical protein
MSIVVTLVRDWVEMMRQQLQAEGIRSGSLKTDEELSLAYWNMIQRRISRQARKVHVAQEFVYPEEHAVAIEALREKFERGDDLNRYRSGAVFNPEHQQFDDRLFNDWGIQHLHLGPENPDERLSGRTNECLYVYLTQSDAYFLDVMPHKQYEKQELMLRMHRNWPEAIAEHRADGVVSCEDWDDSDVKKLRGGGFTYLLTLDGVAYISPGGGYAKSGNSFMALRRSNAALNNLHAWAKWLTEQAPNILRDMTNGGPPPGDPPTFRLVVTNDWQCHAVEWTAQFKIDLGHLLR